MLRGSPIAVFDGGGCDALVVVDSALSNWSNRRRVAWPSSGAPTPRSFNTASSCGRYSTVVVSCVILVVDRNITAAGTGVLVAGFVSDSHLDRILFLLSQLPLLLFFRFVF